MSMQTLQEMFKKDFTFQTVKLKQLYLWKKNKKAIELEADGKIVKGLRHTATSPKT